MSAHDVASATPKRDVRTVALARYKSFAGAKGTGLIDHRTRALASEHR
jgi:hypothetical protein